MTILLQNIYFETKEISTNSLRKWKNDYFSLKLPLRKNYDPVQFNTTRNYIKILLKDDYTIKILKRKKNLFKSKKINKGRLNFL